MCSAVFYVLVSRTLRYSVQVGPMLPLDIGHCLSPVVHTEVKFGQAAKLAASFLAKSKHTDMAGASSTIA